MSASASEVLPHFRISPASVASVKRPLPSLRNSRVPPPSELTSKSKSPSPSTSAKTAPVECCPRQATPADAVTSSNRQLPKFRYSTFGPSAAQKYRSHQPSPSMSPAATPDPLVSKEFSKAFSSET